MKLTKDKQILVVGLGVIGGSYAMRLSEKGFKVTAIEKNKDSLSLAKEKGWIVSGSTTPDKALIAGADIIVIALYPHALIDWVRDHAGDCKSGVVITDVTGVKSGVVGAVQEILPPGAEFIAAHPMAGREKSGAANADASVFDGANFIIVPTERNTQDGIGLARQLGEMLGFGAISVLSPAEHDRVVAFLSQLTHCIAVALMNACDSAEFSKFTGDSFRDLTRIARINDEMWSELFLWNKAALLTEMDRFRAAFDQIEAAVKNDDRDTLRELMRQSSRHRELFDIKKEEK